MGLAAWAVRSTSPWIWRSLASMSSRDTGSVSVTTSRPPSPPSVSSPDRGPARQSDQDEGPARGDGVRDPGEVAGEGRTRLVLQGPQAPDQEQHQAAPQHHRARHPGDNEPSEPLGGLDRLLLQIGEGQLPQLADERRDALALPTVGHGSSYHLQLGSSPRQPLDMRKAKSSAAWTAASSSRPILSPASSASSTRCWSAGPSGAMAQSCQAATSGRSSSSTVAGTASRSASSAASPRARRTACSAPAMAAWDGRSASSPRRSTRATG